MNIYLKKTLYALGCIMKYFCMFFTITTIHNVFNPANYQTSEWLIERLHSLDNYVVILVIAIALTAFDIWKYGWGKTSTEVTLA